MTASHVHLLQLALRAEALIVSVLVLLLIAAVTFRRHRASHDVRQLAEGRVRLARALQRGDIVTTQIWLIRQSPRIQLALCREFVRTVRGAARRDVQGLALRLGLLSRAATDVGSRWWMLRLRGVRVLGALAAPGFEEALCRAAQQDAHAAVREAAVDWSAAARGSVYAPEDHGPTVTGHATIHRADVEVATRELTHPHSDVRSCAIRVLAALEHWPAAPTVYALLDDADFGVRREAAQALARFGAPGCLMLRRALAHSSEQARDAARHVLDVHQCRTHHANTYHPSLREAR